ncbi:MAG: disulfide bond formation protein DsbA [Micrococcales bacterium 73-13]|nr:MAG: disulfide bond formation protein DsbA [Micrococcales bacterium 73-13]
MSEPIKVDIWSDVACPWCFIGKRRFEEAAARFDGEVEVEFHSYELSPDTPEDFPGTHRDYLVGRGFPAEQVDAMDARVGTIAESVGLHYDFAANRPTRTRRAHELIHLAKAHGLQAAMKERLMQAYFERGEHVGRIDDLVRMAGEVGLDETQARTALETGAYAAAVDEDIEAARRIGVRGVPFFVVDGRYGISGAQEAETFLRVLDDVRDGRAAR